MKLTQGQRTQAIAYLTANCDCWKHEGDAAILNEMSDDKLVHLKTSAEREQNAIAVANAAVNGFTSGGVAYRVNPATGQWEKKPVRNASKVDRAQGDMMGSTCNEDEEEALPPRQVAPEKKPMAPPPAPAREVAETDAPAPEEEEEYVGNRRRRSKSLDDWMRTAPVEVQNMVRTAREVEIREKDAIISQLLVNVDERDRQAHRDRLISRTLADLKNDLALVPKAAPADDGDDRQVSNRRQGGQSRRQQRDDDLLVPQTIDWQKVKPGDDLMSIQQPTTTNASFDAPDEDEEYQAFLRTAPEKVRQTLQNAAAVEAKEKRRIIDQLTANVSDDSQEARLRASLGRKSLADLKDMLLIAPPKPRPVQNWFGSQGTAPSAPLGNAYRGQADPNEDVLIPQVIDFRENSKLVS